MPEKKVKLNLHIKGSDYPPELTENRALEGSRLFGKQRPSDQQTVLACGNCLTALIDYLFITFMPLAEC